MMIITEAEPDQDSQPQEDKLNVIISNKAEYFDLLFDLLTEVQEIESSMMEAKEFIGWS